MGEKDKEQMTEVETDITVEKTERKDFRIPEGCPESISEGEDKE